MVSRRGFVLGLARACVAVALLPREWSPLRLPVQVPKPAVSLSSLLPQLLAQGLNVLREEAVMPKLISRDFERS